MMHTSRRLPTWCSLAVAVWPLLFGACISPPAMAQQFQLRGNFLQGPFIVTVDPRPLELTPAQVDMVPSTTLARLAQVDALAADGQWDEALESLLDLADEPEEGLVEIATDRFVSLARYCQMKLARLPAEALAKYRAQIDNVAEAWYSTGVAERDVQQLQRVLEEAYCSSWGDDALMALGEMALAQGDYSDARGYWLQISPLLRSPAGQTPWQALEGIDLAEYWPEVQQTWQQRPQPPDWLAYPDTDLDLAAVQARLVLVSLREGNLQRAAWELELFKRLYPEAVGQLAGEVQPLAGALETMLSAARTWPSPPPASEQPAGTFSAEPLGPLAGPAWSAAVLLNPAAANVRHTTTRGEAVEREEPLRYFPLVVDDLVLTTGSRTIRAAELATGQPAFRSGILYRAERVDFDEALPQRSRIIAGSSRYWMTTHDGIAFARLGTTTTGRAQGHRVPDSVPSGQVLVGLDLLREGLLTFHVEPDNGSWFFEGPPVCDGSRVYVAMRHSDVKPRAYVACYDLASGELAWRTPICSADTPATGRGDEISHGALTLAGDTIYFNTNLGAVAALATEEGSIRWLRRYDRSSGAAQQGADDQERQIAPCVLAGGLVLAAPSDTPLVFALDAVTGKTVWVNERVGGVRHLLGVVGENLLAGGDRLWSLDLRTGQGNYVWPAGTMSGIRGRGHGCIAGSEVFWPTRQAIYVVDAASGGQTRPAIDLAPYSDGGANLSVAQGRLLITGPERLMALGTRATTNRELPPESIGLKPPSASELAR